MRKKVLGDNVYYSVGWSQLYPYDKYTASRLLPELPGILYFYRKKGSMLEDVLCYGCWREGLRMGMRDLYDPLFTKQPYVTDKLKEANHVFKYCVVDTSPADMRDVMYFLISTKHPALNSANEFPDSKRYHDIFVNEVELGPDAIKIETPKFGF